MMKLSWKHCIIYCMKSTLNKVKQNIIYLISCRSYFENIFQKRLMIFDKQSKFSEMQVWNHQHFKMLLGFCTMKFIIDTIPYMKLNINWIPPLPILEMWSKYALKNKERIHEKQNQNNELLFGTRKCYFLLIWLPYILLIY